MSARSQLGNFWGGSRSFSLEPQVLRTSSGRLVQRSKVRKEVRSNTSQARTHKHYYKTMDENRSTGEERSEAAQLDQKISTTEDTLDKELHPARQDTASKAIRKLIPAAVAFYRDTNPQADRRGRTLSQILSWSDNDLERSHDYIQYLFPLPERSPYNRFAPLITEDVFSAFRANTTEGEGLRINLCRAFERMLAFYGFQIVRYDAGLLQGPRGAAIRADDHQEHFPNWVKSFDHNHLRITRIIRCLRLLGLEEEAAIFYEALFKLSKSQDYGGKIGKKSLMFWRRAATRKLWNPPEEGEGKVGEGCEFLVALGVE